MTTISAPGVKDEDFSKSDIVLGVLGKANPKVTPLGSLKVDVSRAGADAATIEDVEPDTIVEVTLEGDLQWITTVERLTQKFPDQPDRSTGAGRDTFRLPTHLGQSALRGGSGGLKIANAAFFNLDLDELIKKLNPAGKAGELAGNALGRELAGWFDDHLIEKPGLYWLDPASDGIKLDRPVTEIPAAGDDKLPYLLFLHGTISNTEGSFGGLWTENKDVWGRIVDRYDGRMLALEHHTLAKSPIENALAVIMALPKKARLHIVSHSRGGMIGELLCRAGRLEGAPFDSDDDELLAGEGYEQQRADLTILRDMLATREIMVERFVRVACPAAGTTLADGKLDDWLSTLMNVIGKLGLDASVFYNFIRGFLLAVVETRTEPEHIPGLEAMMPGSPLTKILNRPDIITSADLSVIAGDIEGEGILHRLGVWLTDRYYPGDHDLVVDTASMYGGMQRVEGRSRRYFEEGPDVYHFRYFKNESTADRIWTGLSYNNTKSGEPPADVPGFLPIPSSDELEDLRSRSATPHPTVFMLPGILGSELRYDDKRIWMSLKQIFKGRLERLDLHRENPKKIEAFRMFPKFYRDLAKYLSSSHNVEPFPYDWRLSMRDEARRFAAKLAGELDGNSLPVRIVAHSMGGLVARLAFALDPDLWRKFQAKEGCRLIMLGTPNRGSFSIARMLMGKEQTTGLLALLDFEHSEKELLNLIRRFRGVLELLPADSHHDFFDERIWKLMDEVDGKGWQEPIAGDLSDARETWRLLDNAPLDSDRMIYVAGQADATPIDMSIAAGKVRFRATGQGDGRVPWETGIPKDMPSYFVQASHGDLPRHKSAFGGYLELVQRGTTGLLSDKQPTLRGAAVPFDLPDDTTPIYPDQETLEAASLGAHPRYATSRETARPVTIQLRLGNLSFSRFPVMVGHYEQDSLNGTEKLLDRTLKGRLNERRRRGLYPGPINTAEVVLDDEIFPPGAVIIGLGEVGGLSGGKLKRALLHGLRRYCLTMEEKTEHEQGKKGRFGLSTLIIGSGADAMGTEDALAALLDALLELQQANQLGGLNHIDVIELYEDRAIAAMRALAKLNKQSRYAAHLNIELKLAEGEGGIRKIVLEKPRDWARRIQIKEMDVAGGRHRGLQFSVLTGRARIEDIAVPDTLKLADAFVSAAIEQTRFDGRSSPGRTLFELLLPRRLKLASDEDEDVVLMLDQFAAGYPWELMEDPSGDDDRPPAIRAGLVRQLHDKSYRPDVLPTTQHSALVVGDPAPNNPDPRFPALKGAVVEAQTVAALISRAGYAVTEEVRTLPTSALATLMNEPYRIMHLAGHGVFEENLDEDMSEKGEEDPSKKPCLKTGMVLGDGLFLTPGAVRQLTQVPELVFLNCCYLGRVDVKAERRTTTQFHELAANLATQFIKTGARVVIAAGWAVDDAAANTFAATFYRAMLQEKSRFIDAVTEARKQTFMAHPYTNSWGAYQAYGDPDFTLNGRASGNGDDAAKWYHPYEAELAFTELAQWAQTAANAKPADLRRRFASLWQSTDPKWRDKSNILAAKAKAAGELGLFHEAIEAYDEAISGKTSEAPIRAIEQRANLRARYAVHLAKGKATQHNLPCPQPLDMIIASWRELERLSTLQSKTADSKPDIEQLNLLGSAAKRASQLYVKANRTAIDLQLEPTETYRTKARQDDAREKLNAANAKTFILDNLDRSGFPSEQLEWLRKSAEYYKKAHDEDDKKAYALTNWLTMCALIHLRDGKIDAPTLNQQKRLLADAAGSEKEADEKKASFWALASIGDLALTKLLISSADRFIKTKGKGKGKRGKPYKDDFAKSVISEQEEIAKAYLAAWQRGGSVLKMSSTMEQLDFIIDALAIGQSESKFERQCLSAALRDVVEAIDRKMASGD